MRDIERHFDSKYRNTFYPVKDVSFVVASPSVWGEMKSYLRKAERVLDVGCGGGTLLYNLARETRGEVYGIDISPEACSMTQRFVPEARVSCQDFLKTDFPEGHFDVVTSTMTIEHCDDVAFIKEVRRVLRRKGKLLITTVLRGKHAWYYLRNEKGETVLELSHVKEYGRIEDLTDLLRGQGFRILRVETPRIRFSILDFLFIRLFSLFKADFFGRLPVTAPVVLLRKLTRVPIPGYYALEVIAEKV